jgi:hypothetical protein
MQRNVVKSVNGNMALRYESVSVSGSRVRPILGSDKRHITISHLLRESRFHQHHRRQVDTGDGQLSVTMKNAVFWDVTPCGSCNNRSCAACLSCQLPLTFLARRVLSPWWRRRYFPPKRLLLQDRTASHSRWYYFSKKICILALGAKLLPPSLYRIAILTDYSKCSAVELTLLNTTVAEPKCPIQVTLLLL